MTEQTTKIAKAWPKPRGPITPDPFTLEIAATINSLLVTPAAIFPQSKTDSVRPLKIGIGNELPARLKPDADMAVLRKAMSRYVGCLAYFLACAQPGAIRHDLDGTPVEPVSETDRQAASLRFKERRERNKRRRLTRDATEQVTAA